MAPPTGRGSNAVADVSAEAAQPVVEPVPHVDDAEQRAVLDEEPGARRDAALVKLSAFLPLVLRNDLVDLPVARGEVGRDALFGSVELRYTLLQPEAVLGRQGHDRQTSIFRYTTPHKNQI